MRTGSIPRRAPTRTTSWSKRKWRTKMAKAYRHALSSANKFGGNFEDYLAIHEKMDMAKMAHAEVNHRVIYHSAFGIFMIEEIFGRIIRNSEGKEVCVRDIAEQ